MSIDYLVCSECGDAFPECSEHIWCSKCESVICDSCIDFTQNKYGVVENGSVDAIMWGEGAVTKCKKCTGIKAELLKDLKSVLNKYGLCDVVKRLEEELF